VRDGPQVIDLRNGSSAVSVENEATGVGRVLRRVSLDEVPVLWNVLRGDMSLVGPRAARPWETAAWAPGDFAQLRVRPGVTGLWQVHGRAELTYEDYQRLDLYYADNWTLLTDLAILARTVGAIVSTRGTY
jgi:lipopolysaccharide/colanic/teichoic acid biosynthesis glycosyltransferase